jgi:hypothetical protein
MSITPHFYYLMDATTIILFSINYLSNLNSIYSSQRILHVNSVMRLEPISTAPTSPGKGDMYFDSTLNKLRVYDGTTWQNCW